MSETYQSISEWCDDTFGPATWAGIAARANQEMSELVMESVAGGSKTLEEAADVVICLARYPGLAEAIERKMAINRARQWRLTGDGRGYHISPAALQGE